MGKKEDDGKVTIFTMQPKPPKKALSAFFLFRQEVYDQVKGENPEAGITKITQIISEKWKTVSEDTKARLEVKYQEEKVRVAKEKE